MPENSIKFRILFSKTVKPAFHELPVYLRLASTLSDFSGLRLGSPKLGKYSWLKVGALKAGVSYDIGLSDYQVDGRKNGMLFSLGFDLQNPWGARFE